VDPLKQMLEAFESRDGDWHPLGTWRGTDTAAIPPFAAADLVLRDLWA
jgi:hypothetical protein